MTPASPTPEVTDEQRAAVEWLRNRSARWTGADNHASLVLAALPSTLTNPQPVVPTEPGWYLVPHDASPSGVIAIELLKTGEWVDNTDSRYLTAEWVRERTEFRRLVVEREPITVGQVSPILRDWHAGLIADGEAAAQLTALVNGADQ